MWILLAWSDWSGKHPACHDAKRRYASAVNGRCVTASESKAIRRGQAGMLALQSLQRQAAAAAEFYVGRIGSVAAAAEAFNG